VLELAYQPLIQVLARLQNLALFIW
jgi:hypothetical protein